jgi:hypothetical protein
MFFLINEFVKNKGIKDMDIRIFRSISGLDLSSFPEDVSYRITKSGKQPRPTYLLGYQHNFINLFEAMRATFVKSVIHMDARLLICKRCGLPAYRSASAEFCKRYCKEQYKIDKKFEMDDLRSAWEANAG